MWHKLSIRWQLVLLLTMLLSVVGMVSLVFTYSFDAKERKLLALEQVETLGRALQHDLVRALANPQADVFADISFRLNGFDSLAALAVIGNDRKEVYRHVRADTSLPQDLLQRSTAEPYFADDFLYMRQPLNVEGYQFGEVVYFVDLASYHTGLQAELVSLLTIFPLELAVCLLLALWIGRSYTRPFTELAAAMGAADVRNNRLPGVRTGQKNEIGVLYHGYNKMIDEIANVTSELTYLSEHDSLTGLYNRYAIERKISHCLQDASTSGNVLISLDIDQFKLVNDNAGHIAGDELLKHVGRICRSSLPQEAMVARTGGDDFLILMPGILEETAVTHTKRLLAALRAYRFRWDGDVFAISACGGLISFKPFEYTLENLQKAVDAAFYAAKAAGHNHLHIYHADDDNVQQYSADLHAAAAIREALNDGPSRFELFAQAIVPLQDESGHVNYEVLLRLRDAEHNLVRPDKFLATANRYQLMTDIDIHVFWNYLEMVTNCEAHLKHIGCVNINLAGATLNNSRFQDKFRDAVAHFDFPWEKLVLEVTETSAVGNLAKASDFIGYCRALGVQVALDDFGTGMASFEYLKYLPIDIVKIDGSFIRDMLSDPVDHAMVSYAHEISKLRGQKTVAEFIESEEQLQALKEIGIDYGQGYYLGVPSALSEWIDNSLKWQADESRAIA